MKAHKRNKDQIKVICNICGMEFFITLYEKRCGEYVRRKFKCPHCGYIYEVAVYKDGKIVKE